MTRLFRASASYTNEGRLRGSYVYLLLFDEHDCIYVKAGQSADPLKRMTALLVGCPFEPRILATCSLPSARVAGQVETALHRALKAWHIRGEWFRLTLADREQFNALWKAAVAEFATPSWPISCTKLNATELLEQRRAASKFLGRKRARKQTRDQAQARRLGISESEAD